MEREAPYETRRDRVFATLLVVAILVVSTCACSPRHLVEYRDRVVHDTTYVAKTEKHTEYVRDSIYVREKGDTVYRYVERWRYRDRYIHDTLVRVKSDTLVVKETVTELVERDLTGWQQFRLWLGNIALALGLAALARFLYKTIHKR